ncbi:MAG: GAF domain-containing protein [Nakamurella sp.]
MQPDLVAASPAALNRSFEAAVPAGEDPARYAHLLRQIRDAALSGARSPAAPRPLVDDSWQRAIGIGMDPDHGRELPDNIGPAEVEFRRHTGKLAKVLPVLGDVLMPAAEDAGHVMVVVDATGVVLWRDGPKKIQQHAARLGFEVGANWSERSVGTNAIGTALVVSRPVQIYSAEHFVKTHHAWTCAAAPILDPANGDLLGVVDVSGAAATVHPSTLALVDAAARMAESFLREEHHAAMGALRALAGPLLAGSHSPTMVTDADGWVAAASTGVQIARIALPEHRDAGLAYLPAFGTCRLEPVPGGWLVRVQTDERAETPATEIAIDLRDMHQPSLSIQSQLGHWSHRLSPRHAELLLLLALHPMGSSAGQLSSELYGSPEHAVAVRAEISRLRKHLGGVLCQRPYRFADWAHIRIDYPTAAGDLLPASTSPTIRQLRSTRSAGALVN